MTCERCGAQNAEGQRFCGSCGAPLERSCPGCGSPNPPGFRFCGACGTSIDETPAAPSRDEGERRNATVLFADLSGFTRLSEQLDPEEVTGVIDQCMGLMGEIVTRFGGTISRIIGDEIMALFGAPLAHEDDPERAVRTALELQVCAREHQEEFRGMPLRIGVNTGETLFGPVGPNRESTVMGDAVNVAKRLQTAAQPGEIFVGDRTYRASRHAIRYAQVAPVQAKGKSDPVPAWRAIAALEQRERPVSAAPLIGRAVELDLLRRVWSRVESERRPHLVTVIGPPGIGKTRVSGEITGGLEALGVRVLRGRSLPYGESTGWGAFAQQIKQLAGILETDPAPIAKGKLREVAGALLAEASGEVTRDLPTLAGLGSEEAAERGALFLAARRLVEAIALDRPTVFIFEDVHWADGTLLDLIEMLAGRTHDVPALYLTLTRPELLERRPSWGGGLPSYTALRLEALGLAESAALVRERLQSLADPAVIDRLVEISGGNPLFLEELAATVTEHTAEKLRELPTTVTDIIAARLDTLPPHERRVLLDASVMGKVFWRGALEGMGGDGRIDDALDALERKDLVRLSPASRVVGDSEYIFKHMLIREVAYQTLPKAARRERHRAVASYIERAAGDRLGESSSLLAHHWREAGESDRAIEYLLAAARHAARAWAKEEAIALYSEALELIPEEDRERRRSVLVGRARERVALGDFEGTAADLDPILDDLTGRERVEAMITRGRAAFWLFRTQEGTALMEVAVREAESMGAPDLHAAALGTLSTTIASDAGRLDEALTLGERGLEMWPTGVAEDYRATIINHMGLFAYWVGTYESAIDHCGRGYDLAVDLQAFEGVVNGGANYGLALAGAGRHEDAVAQFEQVISQGRDYGATPRFIARALNMLGGTLRDLLEVEEAIERNQEGIELARKVAFPVAEAQGGIDLAYADLLLGEAGSAEARLPVLREVAEKAKGFHEWLIAGRMADLTARIALAKDQPEEAAAAAGAALDEAKKAGRLKYQVSAWTTLARALLAMKRPEDAHAEAERAFAGAERLGHPPAVWQAAATLARVLDARGRDDQAGAAQDRAAATVDAFAASLSEQRRGRFLAHPAIKEILAGGG